MNNSALREGEKVAIKGILTLVLLGSLKLAAGIVTGMTVIIADAISTFSDTLGLFASYLGLRLSRRSADQRFEYGYYKIETFAALVISIGIMYLGYYIFRESITTIKNPQVGQFRSFAITATIIAIIHSYRLSKELKKVGEKANSLALIASSRDKQMDVIAGVAIFISIIANYKDIPYVEGIVSMIISFIIFKVGIFSSKESLFFLLDYWNDPALSRKIRKEFKKEKDIILKVKKMKLRRAGTFIFGQAYVEINPFAGIQDLREELNLLQRKILNLNPYIKDFPIYSHIPKSKKVKVAVPIKGGEGLNADVASTLPETTAYLFAQIENGKIGKHYTKRLKPDQKKPTQLDNFLKKENVNILIDNRLNSLIYYNLRRTRHILIYPNFSDIKKVKQTLELLIIDT